MISHSTRTGNSKGHKRWLPFRAWDFESLMYPCVLSAKFLGFFPYEYKNEKYVISKIRLAFATITACFYLALQIYVLYCVNFSNPSVTFLGTVPENFFALLDGSIPILMFLTYYSRLFVFQSVSKVSRILSPQDFNNMAKFLHATHIVNLLLHSLYVPMYYMNRQNISLLRRYVNWFIGVVAVEGLLFYLNCVWVLGACFKKVNECLIRLQEPSTNRQVELAEECLPRRKGAMLLMKVKYYEEMHEKISDAVEYLNKSSRLVNIAFTAGTFISVTFNVYLTMLLVFYSDLLSEYMFSVYEFFSYGVLRLSQLVILVWVCETAMSLAAEINSTIYELANNWIDDTVKRELRYFALQVVHRDNTITTCAFKMNGKLLSQPTDIVCNRSDLFTGPEWNLYVPYDTPPIFNEFDVHQLIVNATIDAHSYNYAILSVVLIGNSIQHGIINEFHVLIVDINVLLYIRNSLIL
ncbi:uncharacterized protein LOC143353953 [Halictus rubicundus]|uniref:uncharacterized protein LOC143353953 n=1 Tax=Halictus rubicundus TaxID=77578 RepID=UPI004035B5FC